MKHWSLSLSEDQRNAYLEAVKSARKNYIRKYCIKNGHPCLANLVKGTISKILNKQEMKITYSTTAYVSGASQGVLDDLRQSLNIWAEGDGSICTTPEAISEWLEDNPVEGLDSTDVELHVFLTEVQKALAVNSVINNTRIGDIIFNL